MAARYLVGCAGMFASESQHLLSFTDEDEAVVACQTIAGGEVYDAVTRRWIGPTCQEEIDAAKARLSDGEA